ncbi:MAG: hypothetical protein MK515_04175 [SAR324 cluster bacterium]|nr:hypothetical protein [SAR324 cluster bacterium]
MKISWSLHQVYANKKAHSILNQTNPMNVHQTSSVFQQRNSVSGNEQSTSASSNQRLSFENIRVFRQHFEQGSTPLRSVLGDAQHQTMMVAMYEGTEKLLNQDVSQFAVLEYLEGLKLTAQKLRQQGISGDQFRTTLLEHAVSTVNNLVRSS